MAALVWSFRISSRLQVSQCRSSCVAEEGFLLALHSQYSSHGGEVGRAGR